HGARRRFRAIFLHQVNARRPVRVAIEERAADPAVQDAGERLVMRLRLPFGDEFVAGFEAPDAEAAIVRGAAAEADVLRGVALLQANLFRHDYALPRTQDARV